MFSRQSRIISLLFPTVLLGVFGLAMTVRAECSPGQMQEADLAYGEAYEFLKAGSWEQAIPRLQSILEMCPNHTNSLNGLGLSYKQLDRYTEAKLAYEKLIEVKGPGAEAVDYGNYGSVLAKLGQYQEARTAYIKAHSLDADDCSVLFNLGMLHMAVQDYRQSVEILEEAFAKCEAHREDISGRLSDACEKAALKEQKIGNIDKADFYREKYHQYAQDAGGSEGYDLVKKLMSEKKYSEAIPVLQSILEKDPEHSPSVLTLARCYAAVGQAGQAIGQYERYLQIRPDYDEKVTSELILAYVDAGRCQNGIALASDAKSRFEPKGRMYLAQIYYAWGKALECTGRYGDAKERFRLSTGCGDPKWTTYSQQEMGRMDQLIKIEELKKQQEAQGG